jgi:hypothetical protein
LPCVQPKFEIKEAAKLLTTFGKVLDNANVQEKKVFFRTVLDEVGVNNRKIVAIRPKPNYYDLLSMSDVRPNGVGCTSDIRILDLLEKL